MRDSQSAPGISARAAASWYIQNAVFDCEYFSGTPADAANARSVAAIRSNAAFTVGASFR
jgi:hypothetical protein